VAAEQLYSGNVHESRLRVLVVEENGAARERITAALGEHYVLHFVHGASQALAAVRTDQPDLLVSEVDLPDGSGLRLCEELRTLPEAAQLPIMLLTSRAGIQDKVAGFQAGADDYVVKPLAQRLFAARLRLLCRIKRIERPRHDVAI
jgi:two-component system, OmpR family, response regulator